MNFPNDPNEARVTEARYMDHDMEMMESTLETIDLLAVTRPKNTQLKYDAEQKRFTEWCVCKNFRDGNTVHSQKLHLYLKDQVVNKPNKKKVGAVVGLPTVKSVAAAIVDLWKDQKSRLMNSHPHPRSGEGVTNRQIEKKQF